MQGITPTVVSIQDAVARQYGLPDPVDVGQTLNTYLGITTPVTTGTRVARAIMFGSDGRANRSARCSHLYSTLPLISRPTSNPLTPSERQYYFLRKVVMVAGIEYEVYYAKALPSLGGLTTQKYGTYATPTSPPNFTSITLPPASFDWSTEDGVSSIIRIAADMIVPISDIDLTSLSAACLLMGITDTTIREVGVVSGIEYSVASGVVDLASAICMYHYSTDTPVTTPGIQMSCGTIAGLML